MASHAGLPLASKVALITGASEGIGAAITIELSFLCAKVVVNYSSDPAPAEALISRIGADKVFAAKADAGDIKDIERLETKTIDERGKFDILVANAGIATYKDLAGTTEEEINVKGPYFLCQLQNAIHDMPRGSHIILTSTSLTTLSTITPNYLLYVSSKGAVEKMTRILAKDLGRIGITVNAIAPGPTSTELFMKGKSEELVETIASWNPHGRLGTPEDIARVVGFLAGEKSGWVNGQILRVDGGMTVG